MHKTFGSLNKETLPEAIDSQLTSSDAFYTRSHFEVPEIDAAKWKLIVDIKSGDVGFQHFEFKLEDLREMPQKTVTATLECAGNSRERFQHEIEGEIQWGDLAVGTATWHGVSLSVLLREKCGLVVRGQPYAICFEGFDSKGEHVGSKRREDGSKFVRYLPPEKAWDEDTLLALKMNGSVLSPEHGYPCRLVVPDWYAMASVKWLARILITNDVRPRVYFNDVKYSYYEASPSEDNDGTPVSEMRIKSIITSPAAGQRLAAAKPVHVRGKAWSGSGKVIQVLFGASYEEKVPAEWFNAKLSGDLGRHAWISWSHEWKPSKSGSVILYSKAIDEKGNTQPELPKLNKYQYGYNAMTRIRAIIL